MTQNDLLAAALETLRHGRTILYPTDTIWGIGCDATDAEAVDRVYRIKKRDHTKAMLVLATRDMLKPDLPEEVEAALAYTKKPTTVILPSEYLREKAADNLPASDDTVGVRIPQMEFCQELLAQFDRPIVSTSANLSGQPSPRAFRDISDEIRRLVDYALPDHVSFRQSNGISSRIVKVAPDGEILIIRE